MFNYEYYNDCSPYHDYAFSDTSPNTDRRLWIVTYNEEDNKWTGILQRLDGAFNRDVDLPVKMVEHIKTFVIIHKGVHR